MLYSEFLKGTRAPETPDTYDQFQIIGQIYEDCEGMTKEEAYRIWKQTYGRELKRRELRQRERLELLINREDYDSADRPHRAVIYHELSTLFWAAYYNKDGTFTTIRLANGNPLTYIVAAKRSKDAYDMAKNRVKEGWF